MTAKQRRTIPVDAANLIATLTTASLTETFATTDRVIENLTKDRDEARAHLAAVRSEMLRLLSGDDMPTPAAMERALWPSRELVERFVEEMRGDAR